ncbi:MULTISPECIES: hypothetical protein [unclassified Sinorhizobium]|uniref:hypothetical protein n=1 Tax=unclassified Sinorhizobium TaxID=2613772 RepID=UPI0035255818
MSRQKIRAIIGEGLSAEGEYPMGHIVGNGGITRIEEETENLGTYGIHWFFVYAGDDLRYRINAREVAVVELFKAADTHPDTGAEMESAR